MSELRRFTTRYVEVEDRIRLAGKVAPDRTVVLWLTRRLLNRLMPHLLEWLERKTPAPPAGADSGAYTEVIQSFAQQAARAEFKPQPPVRVPPPSSTHGTFPREDWLVRAVHVAKSEKKVRIAFKGAAAAEQVSVTFQAQPLRQWLAILHDHYARAAWPLDIWPAWIKESDAPASSSQPVAMH